MQIRNALNFGEGIYASYPWIDPNTEAYITPHSLMFTPDGTHFIAGSRSKFAVYDVNRPYQAAIKTCITSKSRKARKMYGDDLSCPTVPSSIFTAMDISCDDVLALGTTTRHLALYEDHGMGSLITSFMLPAHGTDPGSNGAGITQVKFSSCGTYLFVAERQ